MTAEQFYEQWLDENKFDSHPTREQIYQLLDSYAAARLAEFGMESVHRNIG